jgi:hypothetical protein
MVVSSFTYRGVLLHLLGDDPLGAELVESRRRHLHAMLDLVFAALDDGRDATRATGANRP